MWEHFQAFLTWQSGQSVKSERTFKWLRSRTKLPLQRPPAFTAGISARSLRHLNAMTAKLMGPDPNRLWVAPHAMGHWVGEDRKGRDGTPVQMMGMLSSIIVLLFMLRCYASAYPGYMND